MTRFISLIVVIIFSCCCLVAQTDRLCSTDNYHQNISASLQKNKNSIATKFIDDTFNYNILSNTKICLPVVVNNVYQTPDQKISIAAIKQQIEQLNKDFNANNDAINNVHPYFESLVANINIEFFLVDDEVSENNSKNGINYFQTSIDTFNMNTHPNIKKNDDGGLSSFNTKSYINIWVGNIEAGIKGFATLPTQRISEYDGIVVHYNNFGNTNKTLTHELGHFLGLNHLFGNKEGNCEEDDNVKDTPQTATVYKTCNTKYLERNKCNDPYFEYDLTQNFMNLCNDACLKMFTKGQKVKMLYHLLTQKKYLLIDGCNNLPNNKLDVSLLSLNTIPIICSNKIKLNYEICNVGKTDIKNFTFELKDFLTEQVETFLSPNNCIDYSKLVDISTLKKNTVVAQLKEVNSSNEEQHLSNNTAEFNFKKANLIDLPFEEDFSNTNNWLLIEENKDNNWTHVSDSSGNGKNNACYVFKPQALNELSIGSLYSPVFKAAESAFENTDGLKIHTVSFDVAYASTLNNIVLDYLILSYSNVCADSTYQPLAKVDLTEAVTNLTAEQFLTQQDNRSWKTFFYDFETETILSDLNLKLTYVSANNNQLLIDNFKISTKSQAPLNIQNYISQNKAGLYPNPTTNGIVHFYAERYKGQFAIVNIYNQLGQLRKSFQLKHYEQLNVANLPNGHYYVTFNWNNKLVGQKLLLLK